MPELWCSFATRAAGPANKHGGYQQAEPRSGKGAVVHSAEGYRAGMHTRLDGPATVSWHFSVFKTGEIEQHYPLNAMCWHAQTPANYFYVGIECEGIGGDDPAKWEALTSAQVVALTNLLAWIAKQDGWPSFTRDVTLFEHNHFVATACPSGRIPWSNIIETLDHTPPDAPAPPADPTPRDVAFAGGAFATFMAEGRDPKTMHPYDQGTIKWMASKL